MARNYYIRNYDMSFFGTGGSANWTHTGAFTTAGTQIGSCHYLHLTFDAVMQASYNNPSQWLTRCVFTASGGNIGPYYIDSGGTIGITNTVWINASWSDPVASPSTFQNELITFFNTNCPATWTDINLVIFKGIPATTSNPCTMVYIYMGNDPYGTLVNQ